MANILKLQDQLKGLPDNSLIQYAQNPTGEVPQYLVLGELQRRKTMRDEYSQSQAQAPQSTVAEDLAGLASLPQEQAAPEAAPAEDQGVASLPVPDTMFQEQSMAGGGIVSFDDGGEVLRYAGNTNGSLVGNPDWKGAVPSYDPTASLYTDRAIIEGYRQAYPRLAAKFRADPNSLTAGELNVIKTLQERGEVPLLSTAPAINPFEVKKRLATAPDVIPATTPAAPPSVVPPPPPAAPPPPPEDSAGVTSLPAARMPGLNLGSFTNRLGDAQTVFTPQVLADLQKARKPIYLDEATYVPPELTTDEAAKRVKDVQAAFGVSEAPYAAQSERLKKRESDLAEQKVKAGWLALAEAGFAAAAGTSPYALQNIAAGGLKGLNRFSTSMEKLGESQEKLDAAQFALADAQNRFRQEGSKEAASELSKNRETIAAAKREVARDRLSAQRSAQEANIGDLKDALKDKSAVQQFNLGQRSKEIELALRKYGVDIQALDAQTRANYQQYLMDNPDWDKRAVQELARSDKWKKATGDERAEMVANLVSTGRRSGTGSQGYTYQAQLQKQFEAGGGQYKKYQEILKKEGYDAAEKFRRNWIAGEMGKQPAPVVNNAGWGEVSVSG